MSAVLSREALRARIDTMETLTQVLSAIEDVSGTEREKDVVGLTFHDDSLAKSPIAFVHGIPQDVALAGLHAMRVVLESMLERPDLSRAIEDRRESREVTRA